MPALDWIFASVLLLSMLLGAWRGLVYEVLSLASWIAALVLAQWLALDVAQRLPLGGSSEMVRYAAGFVLVFIAAVMAGGLMAALFKKLMATVGLRPVDRALGAIFGLTRGVLLLLLSTALVGLTSLKASAAWQDSMGVGVAQAALQGIRPALPPDLDRFLSD